MSDSMTVRTRRFCYNSSMTAQKNGSKVGNRYCTHCGAKVSVDDLYCYNCGNKLLKYSDSFESKETNLGLNNKQKPPKKRSGRPLIVDFIFMTMRYFSWVLSAVGASALISQAILSDGKVHRMHWFFALTSYIPTGIAIALIVIGLVSSAIGYLATKDDDTI